jgi:hypothetical protein
MTLFPFTDCCLLLGVDPKTLRLWLTSARLSCTAHPTDARLKCLTSSQLLNVAELHGRCLPDPLPGTTSKLLALSSPAQANPPSTVEGNAHADDIELHHQLSLLQAQVATLQAQVTELALVLIRSSFAPNSQPTTSHPAPLPIPCAPVLTESPLPRIKTPATRTTPPEPERPRTRTRALPLIEVRVDGSVVTISPDKGVLPIVLDTPEWFAWLSSLTAFTFQGLQGSFSATRKFRDGQRIQSWNVHRSLHGRSCNLYLGLTPTLTLAHLEDMATAVYARLTAL